VPSTKPTHWRLHQATEFAAPFVTEMAVDFSPSGAVSKAPNAKPGKWPP
jgi:hypothetical protein